MLLRSYLQPTPTMRRPEMVSGIKLFLSLFRIAEFQALLSQMPRDFTLEAFIPGSRMRKTNALRSGVKLKLALYRRMKVHKRRSTIILFESPQL